MNLYIQIRDGVPFEHPILEENLIQAFPDIDLNNLPSNFARFNRIQAPIIGVYEVYEGITYEWDNDIVKDVHHVRNMTNEEKLEKQNQVKQSWADSYGFPSWIFNEEKCVFDPPIPHPSDGKYYNWNEETTSWVEANI